MELNIKKALLSPFSDNKWYIKLIFPSITMFCIFVLYLKPHVPLIVALTIVLICILLGIMLNGFFIQFRHNEICNNKPLLPEFNGTFEDIEDYFIYGLNSCGIYFMYAIPTLLLSIIGHIHAPIIIAVLTSILFLLSYLLLFIAGSFSQNAYADYFCFGNAVKFKKIFRLMSKVKLEIFIYLILSTILMLLYLCIVVILALIVKNINIIFAILCSIPIIILILIELDLQAQIYKIAKNRLENTVCDISTGESNEKL